jgi:nicotinamide mononucleotide adenylyltransferase
LARASHSARLVRIHILPGRHQPPHNDHLALIERTLELVEGPLFVGLIVSPLANDAATSAIEVEARRQNDPARAPFTFAERMAMLDDALDERLESTARARARVVALPRPEAFWPLVLAMFPEERTWIVPDLGEDFDELKAAWFAAKNDRVLRVRVPPTTDGRRVREMIAAGDPDLEHHVPSAVLRRLRLKEIR